MKVILTYDLTENRLHESKHSQVKDCMKSKGYMDSFPCNDTKGNPGTVYLPNTTLWKDGITPQDALNDIKECAKKHNAELERFFADEFTNNWTAIFGKAYAH